jgi:galactokinase
VIVLSKKGAFGKIKEELVESYKKHFGIDLTFHEIESSDGVQKI